MNPHLQFGYVARAHGLHGELMVRTFDPSSEVLLEIERVWVKRRDGVEEELAVLEVEPAPKNELRVRFEGVDSREDAEGFIGATLFAFRDDLEPPDEDEFFQGDLIGLTVVDGQGKTLGVVEEIWNNGPVPNLVIRHGSHETVLPMADQFVKHVDLEAKKILVELPEYV